MKRDLEGARGWQGGEAQSVQSEEGWLSSAVRKCSKLGKSRVVGGAVQQQPWEGKKNRRPGTGKLFSECGKGQAGSKKQKGSKKEAKSKQKKVKRPTTPGLPECSRTSVLSGPTDA